MSIWGKILGGAGGQGVGGPIGALAKLASGAGGGSSRGTAENGDPEKAKQSVGFTIAVIALGAKMAKADGVVTKDEINAFKEVFRVPKEELANVAKIFNQARRSSAGYEAYAKQVAEMFPDAPEVLEELLWCLAHIAKADHVIHPNELEYLKTVAAIFGLDRGNFERVTELRLDGADADPFQVLGVTAEDDDATIKEAHRRLVREHHPDQLIAKGMPEEFVEVANQKLAHINDAYDRIKKNRAGR